MNVMSIRKIKMLKSEYHKEENFECPKCGKKTKELGKDLNEGMQLKKIYYNASTKKIICYNCGYVFQKEDLIEEYIHEEIETFGFYLRFLNSRFVPCEECQDKIKKMLMEIKQFRFDEKTTIIAEVLDWVKWKFNICYYDKYGISYYPCEKCNKKLNEIFENSDLRIGNNVKDLVEFYRIWELKE